MNRVVAPHQTEASHLTEWIKGSGVKQKLAELNLRSICDPKEIAQLLNWGAYHGTPGWYVMSLDLETGNWRRFGQLKPNVALLFPNAKKAQKYLCFPKGDGVEVILLLPDMDTWQEIAEKYGVPIAPSDIDETRLDLGFWKWVVDNPQLPIAVTEGAKKAGCLMSHGYISICLTGVWNGKQKKKLKAIPTLAPFLVQGRPIHLVFDSDIVVKRQVQEALKYAGYLGVKAGCIVGVTLWEYTEETKGVDDLIVNKGIEAFKFVMDNLVPFKDWLKTLESQFDNSGGLIRLDTRKLIEYIRSTYRDRLKFNVLKQRIELDGELLLTEFAYLRLAEHDGIDTTKSKAIDAFTQVAEENAYNPVLTYLDTVAQQIAPISIDNLSVRYFGTSNPLYDTFLKKTLIAAVARSYEPGCKHDTTLVLKGEQGIGKSSFFEILGGDWFDDSMGDGKLKDDLIILHKSWIQEWGEIERVFSKRQAGELKAFLTRRSDTFRPPYGRTALEFDRRSIIIGSVNDDQFLVDPTGNRRYWVIPIGVDEINLAQLKQERDAIWAAAVAAYRKGETWWLDREEEKLSAENNHSFEIVDEWQSAIATYLEGREKTSITELLQQVFDYELGQIQRRDQMRVANILTSLKWKKAGQKQHQGKRQVVWVLPSQTHTQQEISTPAIPFESESDATQSSYDNSSQETEKVESFGIEEPKKQLIKQTTKEVRRIGWGKKQGIACIKQRYGVGERSDLSVEELVDFRDYLRGLPSK
ncbi:MAG: VapE family protein [Pleurocapsa sp. MO_226.B13]|nr:VapE family protein [Pleurocapsa sp. MO_226.B13]